MSGIRDCAVEVFVNRNACDRFSIEGGQAELPQVVILPAEALLYGLVQVSEGRGGANQKAPPDARLDTLQRDIEFKVTRHGILLYMTND